MGHAIGTGLMISAAIALAAPAEAAVMRAGDEVIVPAGQTITDDLYVAGGDVTIDGRVTGDLVIAGGTITVNGRVDGDVLAAGGQVRLNGPVGETVRAASGDLRIAAPIEGDLLGMAGALRTTPQAAVSGESYLSGGDLRLDGRLGQALEARAGSLRLGGTVDGPARLYAESLTVGPGARITGPLAMDTESASPIAEGAVVQGEIRQNVIEREEAGGLGGWVLGFLMALVVGLTLLWLMPATADRSSRLAVHSPGQRLLIGFLTLLVAPTVAVLFMITVVGIPLGLLLLAAFGIALYLSQLVVAWTAGRRLLAGRVDMRRYAGKAGALALGLLIVYLLRAIPFLGWLVTLAIVVWGLGTLVALAHQRHRAQRHAEA